MVRIAVGLRLGLNLCLPHECILCGVAVDASGTHGLSCRFSRGRDARHSALNVIIKRSLDSAKIPSHLEPVGLSYCDVKRPDGATVVPWREGRALVWDATCPDTLAPSNITLAASKGGGSCSKCRAEKAFKVLPPGSFTAFCPCCDRDPGSAWSRG